MTKSSPPVPTQVHRVFIKATPEAIWQAITTPEWSTRYGYAGPVQYDLRPGGKYVAMPSDDMKKHGIPDVPMVDGEVVESDPPRKLVQTWRFLWDQTLIDEGFTRVTWEIEPAGPGITALTVIHELASAPKHAEMVGGTSVDLQSGGGGWAWILSDLKTLLESGNNLWGG